MAKIKIHEKDEATAQAYNDGFSDGVKACMQMVKDHEQVMVDFLIWKMEHIVVKE